MSENEETTKYFPTYRERARIERAELRQERKKECQDAFKYLIDKFTASPSHEVSSQNDSESDCAETLYETETKDSMNDNIEINLFEPECILMVNAKAEVALFPIEPHSTVNCSLSDLGSSTSDFEENVTVERIGKLSEIASNANRPGESILFGQEQVKLGNAQTHSIVPSVDKRLQPKEIFTQCNFCGKFVISRVCDETGTYSKCIYCFTSLFNSDNTASIENLDDEPSLLFEPEISIETNVQFSVNLSAQLVKVTQSKSDNAFKCNHCGKIFTRNWYLKQHVKLHLNQKPFGCEFCDKRFLNTSNLKQHMRTHSIEYRCRICQKTCINQNSLDEHVAKHEDSATQNESTSNPTVSMECNYCPQKFASVHRLKEHLQSHTKESPFHCDKCDKSFRYSNSLTKHKKLHNQNEAI